MGLQQTTAGEPEMDLSFWILGGLLSVLAVVGNGVVVVLISTRRRLHTTANWFVLSLAVADCSLGAIVLPLQKACDVYSQSYPQFCDIRLQFTLVGIGASVTNLCVMTLDRYIAIVKPLRYFAVMKQTRVRLLISAAWILALIRPVFRLRELIDVQRSVGEALKILETIVYQIIPCVALLLATSHILLIVRKHTKQTAALAAQLRFNYSRSDEQVKMESTQTREAPSARVIVAVVVVFLLCFGINIYAEFFGRKDGYLFKYIFKLLLIANSAANPIAYAFLKVDIRRELRHLFRCQKVNQ